MRTFFPDGAFDAAVSFYAITHIPRDEHEELFRRVHRLLRTGGLFLATLGPDAWVSTEAYEPFGVRTYWSHYGPDENLRILSDAGFRIPRSSIEHEESQGEPEATHCILAERTERWNRRTHPSRLGVTSGDLASAHQPLSAASGVQVRASTLRVGGGLAHRRPAGQCPERCVVDGPTQNPEPARGPVEKGPRAGRSRPSGP